MLSVQEFKESLEIAEHMARLSLNSNRKKSNSRGKFSQAFLKDTGSGEKEDNEEEIKPYVPPKQLLMYMVR